jgi:hypothetical protein
MSSLYLTLVFLVSFTNNAFPFQIPNPSYHYQPTSSRICLSNAEKYDSQETTSDAPIAYDDHPDVICWTQTLQSSPNNSFVHPSLKLILRPPSQGGTGILATGFIPRNTTVLSLDVDEVPIIDAESFFGRYEKCCIQRDDEVLNLLLELWRSEKRDDDGITKSDMPVKIDAMIGILAHLTLTRYRDLSPHYNILGDDEVNESFILKESRRLGYFLDSMPLFPNVNYSGRCFDDHDKDRQQRRHPFPSHFIFWKENERSKLLKWTLAGRKSIMEQRVTRDCIREWHGTFLRVHPDLLLVDVINAIESSHATLLSRAFGIFPSKKVGEDDDDEEKSQHQLLVPLADKMNHVFDKQDVNLIFKSRYLNREEEQKCRASGERVTYDLLTVQDVDAGDELFTSYGRREDFVFANNYGFVNTAPERFACSGIPILPRTLDLDPRKKSDAKLLDLREIEQWVGIMDAVKAAVNWPVGKRRKEKDAAAAAVEHRYHFIAVSPLEGAIPRHRPVCQFETKLGSSTEALRYRKGTIKSILPAFRAAANALAQLRYNYQNGITNAPMKLKNMVLAAARKDLDTDWDAEALKLMHEGITERIKCLKDAGEESEAWLKKVGVHYIEEREIRADMARDIRASEIEVLESLDAIVLEWQEGAVGY